MTDEELDRLRKLSEKEVPMVASTVRFSRDIDNEIRNFCGDHPSIKRAVILRDCVERAWKEHYSQGAEKP